MLVDEEHLSWKEAWDIACNIFSYTTHTVVPEGLEKIPVDLLGSLLPRHLQVGQNKFQFLFVLLARNLGCPCAISIPILFFIIKRNAKLSQPIEIRLFSLCDLFT